MAKFIMLIGLPGSGKSTYAQTLISNNADTKYLSSDKIREELYGDEAIQGNPNTVFTTMHNRVVQFLSDGYDVVYDATNVNRKNRKSVLNIISCFDVVKEAHIVWCPFETCVTRDASRKRTVGEHVIRKMIMRWESPYYDEGFNCIKLICSDNSFDVNHYKNCMLDNMNIPHDNPHHEYDVLGHCLEAEKYCYAHKFKLVLCESAKWHDIGKPFTKGYKSDENGKLIPIAHYYQHDNVGGYLVYGCYMLDEPSKNFGINVSYLVSNHMQPFFNSAYYKTLTGAYKRDIDRLHEADINAH